MVIVLSGAGWLDATRGALCTIGASVVLTDVVSFILIPSLRRRLFHARRRLSDRELLTEFGILKKEDEDLGLQLLRDFARHYRLHAGTLRANDRRTDLCLAPRLLFDWADTQLEDWFVAKWGATDQTRGVDPVPETVGEIVRILVERKRSHPHRTG